MISPLQTLQGQDRNVEVLVIGAGIVGISIALRLQQRGHQVLVVERQDIAAQASRGNAGVLAFSQILPLASPRIMRKVPRWMLDPLGPMTLRPAYLPRLLPWLWRFWQASLPANYQASTQAQAALQSLSATETIKLYASVGAQGLIHETGLLSLYESQSQWQAAQPDWRLCNEYGIETQHLHGVQALAELQPGLSPQFVAGTFAPGSKMVENPLLVTNTLAQAFEQAGGRIRLGHVNALQPLPDVALAKLQDDSSIHAKKIVLAAGAWSHHLAQTLGENIPLETERGYNTTLPQGSFALRRALSFENHGFVVTPISGGVRVGGAVEFAGLQSPPNFKRSAIMLSKAKRFLPELHCEGGTRWMGFRPSLPDSLPVISPAKADPRFLYAFGHGHWGLTQSAATALLITELLESRPTSMDVKAFAVERFL